MPTIENTISYITAAIALIAATYSVFGAVRSGAIRSLRFGNFEIQGRPIHLLRRELETEAGTPQERDFETAQLERYYSQILSQSKISFWFSLIFASLGFAVIIMAAVFYDPSKLGVTVTQAIAGVVMDAVSSLFFIQSRKAHEAMANFFEKLRRDRLHSESRRLCDEVSDPRLKDALRVQLILHYAEIPESTSIASRLLAHVDPARTTNEVA